MKSKKLSSDLTLFKKDITRFAPLWLVWCVMYLIIGYVLYINGRDLTDRYDIFPVQFVIANMIYGFVCAVTLFGYLFDPKECITTHSLPIRRENLFLVHLLSGLVMHIVPTAIFCLSITPLCNGNMFAMFGFMVMQFVFFYGLGIFCVTLTGRKFAAAAMFGLINFASPLVYLATNILYVPLLPGIQLNSDPFMQFCPPATMMYKSFDQSISWINGMDFAAYAQTLAIFTAIGVGLMIASVVLYRIRKLECAESFMAFPKLNILFVLVCTLFCGCFFTSFFTLFTMVSNYWITLTFGTVIGYFASIMILRRSAKVFNVKSIVGLAVFTVLLAGSLLVTDMDPLGLVTYVPSADQVARVELRTYESSSNCYFTEDPEQIEKLEQLHQELIVQQGAFESSHPSFYDGTSLIYRMKDGRTVKRAYRASDSVLEQVYWYMSQPEYQLGVRTIDELLEKADLIELTVYHPQTYEDEEQYSLSKSDQEALLKILFDECKAGNMYATSVYYYNDTDIDTEPPETVYSLIIDLKDKTAENVYDMSNTYHFEVPQAATNAIAWLAQYVAGQS